MPHEFKHPVIGQEAICPDGLGRVRAFKDSFPHQWIQVDTYIENRSCQWGPHNVVLVDSRATGEGVLVPCDREPMLNDDTTNR